MTPSERKALITYLTQFVSDNRTDRFDEVLSNRTRHITVVLEDIYQEHNASAVLRSCDCFGIQDVHIIENRNNYKVNPDIALGSSQWINLIKYKKEENNTLSCIKNLKANGYKIIATSPHKNDTFIQDLDISSKTALVFGTELHGISNDIMQHADGFVKIPMYGFTESFNISVSAALCMHTLTNKLHKSAIQWQLSDDEKEEIRLTWLRNTIKKVELIEADYHNKTNTR